MVDAEDKVKVKRRGANRRLFALAFVSVVILAGLRALIYIQTRPRWTWYVSPPIDAQGHRVHILCRARTPYAYQLTAAYWDGKDDRNYSDLGISMGTTQQSENMIRRMLVRLHLLLQNKTHESITLLVGPAIHPGAGPFGQYVDVNKTAEVNKSGKTALSVWVSRTMVAVPGGREGVCARYDGPIEYEDSLAIGKEICRSMYVK